MPLDTAVHRCAGYSPFIVKGMIDERFIVAVIHQFRKIAPFTEIMKTDSLTNLFFLTVTPTAKMVRSAFSFVKELSSIKNDPASLLFPKKSFGSASATPYPEELDNEAKIECPDINIHAWRAENKNLTGLSFVRNMLD